MNEIHISFLFLLTDKLVKPTGSLPKGRGIVALLTKKMMRRLPDGSVEEVIKRFICLRLIIRMQYLIGKGKTFARKRRAAVQIKIIFKKLKLSN